MNKVPQILPPWSSPNGEPKRQYKFLLNIDGIPAWIVKSVNKPEITIGEASYKFMLHTFKFPGQVTWNNVSATIIDRVDINASQILIDAITAAGYTVPGKFTLSGPNNFKRTISKSAQLFKTIEIDTTDLEGVVVERWTLHNAWIKSAGFGEASYDSEDIVNYKIEFAYDWAELQTTFS
jgi:hypothetical protein